MLIAATEKREGALRQRRSTGNPQTTFQAPGVDLVYYGNQRQLEYGLVVQPGADTRQIVLDVGAA